MRAGYGDPLLDGLTAHVARYHEPDVRVRLRRVQAERDRGQTLRSLENDMFGSEPDQPHLHPSFGNHNSRLRSIALAREYVSPDIVDVLNEHGVSVDRWPPGVPRPDVPEPTPVASPSLDSRGREIAVALGRVEAMMHAFHLEHVATTAHHIGSSAGTGGTEGVGFLLIAAFRRAFPRLWLSGEGSRESSAARPS
jgi:hypothetical protein